LPLLSMTARPLESSKNRNEPDIVDGWTRTQ
jgi:hypothetical protein